MPALKYSHPDPDVLPAASAPPLDFHGVCFHRAQCETRPLTATEAPRSDHDLVVRLGRMPVDLAAPLLRSSLPALNTAALLALIATTGEAHHVLIAARPGLDWRVVRALIKSGNDSVLLALVRNAGIDLDSEDRERLERLAGDRPDLHGALLERYGRPRGEPDAHGIESHDNLKMLVLLRKGEISSFVREAARRLKLDKDQLHRVLSSESAVPLALGLRALDLDRAVFLHLLPFWQAAHRGAPAMNASQRPVILSIFGLMRDEARRKLAAMISG